MECYVCGKVLNMYGKESPLDGERVCDSCYEIDLFNNDNLDLTIAMKATLKLKPNTGTLGK